MMDYKYDAYFPVEPYETVFLQWGLRENPESLTWCQDRILDEDVPYTRKDLFDAVTAENVELHAAMTIAGTRLLDATNRIGAVPAGCDTAEWLVDEIIRLRAELNDNHAASCADAGVVLELRAELAKWKDDYLTLGFGYSTIQEKYNDLWAEHEATKPDWRKDVPDDDRRVEVLSLGGCVETAFYADGVWWTMELDEIPYHVTHWRDKLEPRPEEA